MKVKGYLYTKIPEMWVLTLNNRPATAADWKLAINLLARARWTSKVKITNTVTEKLGMSRATKWRSLDRLENWGLILVERRQRRSPVVTVLWRAEGQPGDSPAGRFTDALRGPYQLTGVG